MLQDMGGDFDLRGELTDIEITAVNLSIRERRQLREQFGSRRWRKLKAVRRVRFPNGEVRLAEATGMRRTACAGVVRPPHAGSSLGATAEGAEPRGQGDVPHELTRW
jgi:hypothetical protein